jgi:hypothetical protein
MNVCDPANSDLPIARAPRYPHGGYCSLMRSSLTGVEKFAVVSGVIYRSFSLGKPKNPLSGNRRRPIMNRLPRSRKPT